MAQAGEGVGRGRAGASQGRRRRLLVVLAAVALIAVVPASAFAGRAFVIDKGIVGLPPTGATPSTPKNGVLEMYYQVLAVVAEDRSWIYADGRLIRLGAPPRRGFIEQRLTREGAQLLRSEILSAGGFGRAQPPPGSTLLDPLSRSRYARVTFSSPSGGRSESQASRGAAYKSRGSALPASAWKQPKTRACVPSRLRRLRRAVVVSDLDKPAAGRVVPMGPARIVALLPAAAENVLRGRDWRTEVSRGPGVGPGVPGARRGVYGGCSAVTTNEARSLAKALDGAGPATARKGGWRHSELEIRCPGPEPPGLDQPLAGPPAWQVHLDSECCR